MDAVRAPKPDGPMSTGDKIGSCLMCALLLAFCAPVIWHMWDHANAPHGAHEYGLFRQDL